jgi:hypothetical protein
VLAVLTFAALLAVPAALTFVGHHKRGNGIASAVVAAIFFPVAWAVWYVRDEHPYRAAHR